MNNTFKRMLSSILATVMIVSVFVVGNVSSVLADDNLELISGATGWLLLGIVDDNNKAISLDNENVVGTSGGTGAVPATFTSEVTNLKLNENGDETKTAAKFNANTNSDISKGNYVKVKASANDTIYVYAYTNTNDTTANGYINASESSASSSKFLTSDAIVGKSAVSEVKIPVKDTFEGDYIYIYASGTSMNIAAIVKVPGTTETTTVNSYVLTPADTTDGTNNIYFGFSTISTSTVGPNKDYVGNFEDKIFKDESGNETNELNGQQYINISDVSFTPTISGNVKMYIARNDGTGKPYTVTKKSTEESTTYCSDGKNGRKDTGIKAISFDVVADETYTFSSLSGLGLFYAVLVPATSGKLSGTVSSVKNYSFYSWKSNGKYSESTNECVVLAKTSDSTKVSSGKVTLTYDDGTVVETNINEDGTYSFEDLKEGTATVSTTVGGVTVKKSVEIVLGSISCDLEVAEKSYDVTIRTNIKDYKNTITIYSVDGDTDTEIATINDITYYDSYDSSTKKYSGFDRDASVERKLKLPAGTYKYQYNGTNFVINNNEQTGTFTVSGNTTVELNFSANATETVDTSKLKDYVSKGTYTIDNSASSKETVLDGLYAITSTNDSGFVNGNGYVVFRIKEGESYLANISTAKQACVIYSTDGGTINGTDTSAAVDSSYGTYTVTLTAGTYVIKGTTANAAEIKSIRFFDDSVFKFKTYDAESGSIIGYYDYSNDGGNGTTGVEDYEAFALLISDSADNLTFDKVNNIANYTSYIDEDYSVGITGKDGESKNIKKITFTDNSGNKIIILKDETDKVYKSVAVNGTDEEDDFIMQKNPSEYYYAMTVDGKGTYYVTGATKYNDKWLVEDTAKSFTIQ